MEGGLSGKRFGRLLVGLLAYIFLTPFIPLDSQAASIIVHGFLSLMLYLAAGAVQKEEKQRSIAMGLMGVALVFHWLGVFSLVSYSVNVGLCLFAVFYTLLIYEFTKQLLQVKTVNSGAIMVALCLYLIVGLLWGVLYTLLQVAYDGAAFSGVLLDHEGTSAVHLFNYFSMVTLTTLGYGDITPQVSGAASLCQMEAIIGQFYTAVLVAWLVGMYGKPLTGNQEKSK